MVFSCERRNLGDEPPMQLLAGFQSLKTRVGMPGASSQDEHRIYFDHGTNLDRKGECCAEGGLSDANHLDANAW